MSYLLLCAFAFGFLPGISSEPADHETASEPVEPSSFTCQGRPSGYYADLETGCKSYHVCDGPNHFTYTCPERTLFQQRSRICDHSYLVRCEDSVHYYEGEIYQDLDEGDFEEEEEEEEDEGGVDYEYGSNKEEVDDFKEDKEEPPTPSTETVKRSSQEPTETTSAASATADTDPSATTTTTTETRVEDGTNGKTFLKFSLKDPRWLFYIPEVERNSIETRRAGIRELVLPLDAADERMKFRPEVEVGSADGPRSVCPRACDLRFLVPGTCHPCIMIK